MASEIWAAALESLVWVARLSSERNEERCLALMDSCAAASALSRSTVSCFNSRSKSEDAMPHSAVPVSANNRNRAVRFMAVTRLYVANLHCLLERSQHVRFRRDELLRDMPRMPRLGDGAHDRGVMQFLRIVDLMPARDAAGVVVREVFVAPPDGGDDVALHDLHVVDVVEQTEIRGPDLLAQRDAPRALVALIIGMIDAAVQ